MKTTWKIDNIHSYIGFKIKMLGISSIRGNFKEYSGSFVVRDNWETSKIFVEGSIASIDTANKLRDEHLQDSYFFDGIKYPKWTFASKEIRKEKENQYLLMGDLTLKGITKQIEITLKFNGYATDKDGMEKAGFSGKGKFLREDFGVAVNALLPNGNIFLNKKAFIEIDFQLTKINNHEI